MATNDYELEQEIQAMKQMACIGGAMLDKNRDNELRARSVYLQERQVIASERIAGALERIRDCFEDAAAEAEQLAEAIEQASNSNESDRS